MEQAGSSRPQSDHGSGSLFEGHQADFGESLVERLFLVHGIERRESERGITARSISKYGEKHLFVD